MRKTIPIKWRGQYELAATCQVFNLAGQATGDGARMQAEAQQAARTTAEAREIARRAQRELFTQTLPVQCQRRD